MNPLRYVWQKGIASAFLTGLFVLLPVILTFLIIEWIVAKLRGALGPGSVVGVCALVCMDVAIHLDVYMTSKCSLNAWA